MYKESFKEFTKKLRKVSRWEWLLVTNLCFTDSYSDGNCWRKYRTSGRYFEAVKYFEFESELAIDNDTLIEPLILVVLGLSVGDLSSQLSHPFTTSQPR